MKSAFFLKAPFLSPELNSFGGHQNIRGHDTNGVYIVSRINDLVGSQVVVGGHGEIGGNGEIGGHVSFEGNRSRL